MFTKIIGSKSSIFLLTIAVLLGPSLVIRILMLGFDLPYYSIDENDIVEPALAFVAGDWDPRWYKYGPLFSYLLAIIFGIQQWVFTSFFDGTSDEFFYSAFFEPTMFYYIARSFHLLVILVIAFMTAKFCWRYYDRRTAYVVLLISVAPLIELITGFTVRVDTLQGLFALICLYFAVSFKADERFYKSYVVAGIFAGLAFAVKPLTGVLVLPAVFAAHIFTYNKHQKLLSSHALKFLLIDNRGMYIFLILACITHSVVHPYSVINFADFWGEQYQVIFSQSDQGGTAPGYSFVWLFEKWGLLPAMLALFVPVILFFNREKPAVVLITYVLTFTIVFLFFKTRSYWYISIIPVLFILMARLITEVFGFLSYKYSSLDNKKTNLALIVAALLIIQPLIKSVNYVGSMFVTQRADQAAQEWVEDNIPERSKILLIGWYALTLPRLRSMNPEHHAIWAEHFMYKRNENQAWIDKFRKAHAQFLNSSLPKYNLIDIRNDYHNHYNGEKVQGMPLKELFTYYLPKLAHKNHAEYIITASSVNYTGKWENTNGVTLLASFNNEKGYTGAEVKIFHVN